jgi:hypothetical protein
VDTLKYPEDSILDENKFLVCRFVKGKSVVDLMNLLALHRLPCWDDRDLTLVVNQTVRVSTRELLKSPSVVRLTDVTLMKYQATYFLVGLIENETLSSRLMRSLKIAPMHVTFSETDPKVIGKSRIRSLRQQLTEKPFYIRLSGERSFDPIRNNQNGTTAS